MIMIRPLLKCSQVVLYFILYLFVICKYCALFKVPCVLKTV